MAITINKEPQGIYPVYNDSFIHFKTSLTGSTESLIKFENINTPFLVYGNLKGEYVFNLKNIVKINFNDFDDVNNNYPSQWGESIEGSYLNQILTITDYNANTTGTSITRNYEFFKSVKQIGDEVFNNNGQILNHSKNGIDYNLTYFEGYPFSFDLQRINKDNQVKVRSINNNITSEVLSASTTNSFRIYIDKSVSNWSTSKFLPLSDNLNKLEIFENDSFKSNLNLKKIEPKCGVYLKWFNNNGGYSFWLFDEYFKTTLKSKSLKTVNNNKFLNVTEGLTVTNNIIGKSANEKIKVKTSTDENEVEILKDLILSPSVQLYTSKEPYTIGKWVNVNINGDFNIYNKKKINQLEFTIELPEQITIQL